MIESDILSRAFKEFDADGKGYISEGDLQRVLRGFGWPDADGVELHAWLEGAAGADRERKRVTFGSFVRMMTHTVKQSLPAGSMIFEQGDPVRFFYCLLKGELEVVRVGPRGGLEVLNTLRAGEYFGENSLLEGNRTRSVSMRCATPVEILKLSKEDFDEGFGGFGRGAPAVAVGGEEGAGAAGQCGSGACVASDEELRSKLLGFLQVCPPRHRTVTAPSPPRDHPVAAAPCPTLATAPIASRRWCRARLRSR